MTNARVIRYKTTPESAARNEDLIRDVFAELAKQNPDGLRYAAFRLADGVSFLHVAMLDGEQNPLTASAAFAEFQSGIADRCVEGPAPTDATVIGCYGLLPEGAP
jgi:hypothetical protein